MDSIVFVLTIVAVVVAWNLWTYRQSGGWNPLWMAFSTTAVAAVSLIAGVSGYRLGRHDQFVAHTAWAGHVIWSQILFGLLASLVAAYFWRKGLQRIRRP